MPLKTIGHQFPLSATAITTNLVASNKRYIRPQFWRPEVLNQSIGSVALRLKAPAENPALPLPASGATSQLQLGLGLPRSNLCPASPQGFLLCILSPSVFYVSPCQWIQGPKENLGGSLLKVLNVIRSAKTLCANKVSFTGSEWISFWGLAF